MNVHAEHPIVQTIHPARLTEFLCSSGWTVSREGQGQWLVFQKLPNGNKRPIKIVLPVDHHTSNAALYTAGAVNVLCSFLNADPETVADILATFDRDMLSIRNLEAGEAHTIPLELAAKQLPALKQLVGYAAPSHPEPELPFVPQVRSDGQKIIEHYRFGINPGSSSLRLESHITRPSEEFVASDAHSLNHAVPRERLVLERIIRGLIQTRKAVQAGDIDLLLEHYAHGLNANMCQAVVALADDKKLPLECRVAWSSRIEPSDDVRDAGVIELRKPEYDLLEEAAHRLMKTQPAAIA